MHVNVFQRVGGNVVYVSVVFGVTNVHVRAYLEVYVEVCACAKVCLCGSMCMC